VAPVKQVARAVYARHQVARAAGDDRVVGIHSMGRCRRRGAPSGDVRRGALCTISKQLGHRLHGAAAPRTDP